jgi:hypothetical protein
MLPRLYSGAALIALFSRVQTAMRRRLHPLFGATNALAANVVVKLSISVVPSVGARSLFSGLLFAHELPDSSKNPEDQAKIQ